MKRAAGILMPLSSLPSPYGIGTLGAEAFRFARFLHEAGQSLWQILPLGPCGSGDSPYSSLSSFAGDPNYIDLDLLADEGLLDRKELEAFSWGRDPEETDYSAVRAGRELFLHKAFGTGREWLRREISAFTEREAEWLLPYARFMSLKKAGPEGSWTSWDRAEEPDAEEMEYQCFLQFLFDRQYRSFKDYVNGLGIRLIGDIPVYVPMDSADVFADPQNFRLGENFKPELVSGVPPDYFSKEGQLWGNPLYNYEKQRQDGYRFWIRRIGKAAERCDALRIDHFRGLSSYWAVPASEKTAINGHWEQGPGMDLVGRLTEWFSGTQFLAEDLGVQTEDVRALLEASGLPGMRVLEFAWNDEEPNEHAPENVPEHCVLYTGTHDNAPLKLWEKEAEEEVIRRARKDLHLSKGQSLSRALIRAGMESKAALFMVQMQDWLGLSSESSRMNTPGLPEGCWRWRMKPGRLTEALAARILDLTEASGRL